ncbi:hypothetical protein [Vibrio sp.]|uniref:hypothetical protein n=1 Tax=Vibrio sp. TaxID=678 RepID=UPI003D0B9161
MAYLLGQTDIKREMVLGDIVWSENGLDINSDTYIDGRYYVDLAEKICPEIKGVKNRWGTLRRVLEYDEKHGKFIQTFAKDDVIEKRSKEYMEQPVRITIDDIDIKRPKTVLTVNVDNLKVYLKKQEGNKEFHKAVEWFFENPTLHPSLKPEHIAPQNLMYLDIQRYYIFKHFFEFSKNLLDEVNGIISFKGLFNAYLLHVLFSLLTPQSITNIQPVLLFTAFTNAANNDPFSTCYTFTSNWTEKLDMEGKMGDETNDIIKNCEDYFEGLAPELTKNTGIVTITTDELSHNMIEFLSQLHKARNHKWLFS